MPCYHGRANTFKSKNKTRLFTIQNKKEVTMQIELSEKDIELVLKSIMANVDHINRLLNKGSIFQEDFKNEKRKCSKLYDKIFQEIKITNLQRKDHKE